MATSKVKDERTWRVMLKLGLTRVPTSVGTVDIFPDGPLWHELVGRFEDICRKVLADPEIQAAIRDRARAEMRGEADLLVLRWLSDSREGI